MGFYLQIIVYAVMSVCWSRYIKNRFSHYLQFVFHCQTQVYFSTVWQKNVSLSQYLLSRVWNSSWRVNSLLSTTGWVRCPGCLSSWRICELMSDEAECPESSHYWRQSGGRSAINHLCLNHQSSSLVMLEDNQKFILFFQSWLLRCWFDDTWMTS